MSETYFCEDCDYRCSDSSNWNRHQHTLKHLGITKKVQKSLTCDLCDFVCYKHSKLDIHKNTAKHKRRLQEAASTQKATPPLDYATIISQLLSQNNELKNFILEQVNEHKKETTEIMNKVIETAKTSNTNTITANTINNNNQKFNINVFLNETCKDAMNLSDFVKSIEVSREDLENNAQLGFVGGISKIFLDNLRQLSVNKRPIHCTDLKREIMHIKDDDKWTKEVGPAKLNTVIQTISQKSTRTLLDWKAENPDYRDHDSEFSNLCIVIQRNSMAGYDRDTYYPKVIRAIAKEVMV